MFWEACHAARILADAAGGRSPGSVHHRHPRRSVYPHACAPRRFERDDLLPHFQGVMTELFAGLNYKVWVDDIVWWWADEDNLLNTRDKILGRLEDAGLFTIAHKCLFFDAEISWCGKVYSWGQAFHDRECLSGLASMRRPQTAGELMQLLQAVNELRTLGWQKLSSSFECCWTSTWGEFNAGPCESRQNWAIAEEEWKRDQVAAWSNTQDLVANAVALMHPKDGYEVLMFPDASDNHWGSLSTQVPATELKGGIKAKK